MHAMHKSKIAGIFIPERSDEWLMVSSLVKRLILAAPILSIKGKGALFSIEGPEFPNRPSAADALVRDVDGVPHICTNSIGQGIRVAICRNPFRYSLPCNRF